MEMDRLRSSSISDKQDLFTQIRSANETLAKNFELTQAKFFSNRNNQ